MSQVLVGRQFQASLDLGPLQDLIVFPAHHKRQSSQVSEDSTCAILPVEAQERTLLGMVMRLEIALNGRDCPTQFCTVFSIARVSKRAEKLMGMSLQNRGTAPHDFPSLASSVARRTQGAQTSLWIWPILRLRQGTLAGRLACSIHIEDEVVIPLPVEQSAWLPLCH